jgi:hypothetical protein
MKIILYILLNTIDIKSRTMRLVETCSIFGSEEKRVLGSSGKFKERDFLKPKIYIVGCQNVYSRMSKCI